MTHLNALAAAAQPFLGFPLAPSQLDQFERFLSEILEWNAKFNLTAIRDPESIRVKHFLDSLTVALATGDLNRKTLADVGTGAGFPGIPLKIAFPELKLTLIDSIGKKLKFCERVCALFGWTDVATLHARVEDAGRMPQLRERQDFAVARAVTRLPVLCEYLMPLVTVGGAMLAQKSAGCGEEIADAETAIALLGGTFEINHQFDLPGLAGDAAARVLVVIRKRSSTPARYPRQAGTPLRKPLG